jgi:adenosylhomocysteine nucleosidase
VERRSNILVVISADTEWKAVRQIFPDVPVDQSPYGEYFLRSKNFAGQEYDLIYFHGGWGKISAAASAQYAIDLWKPKLLINLGTCGGFEGEIGKGEVVLVERTIVYDIIEEMGDNETHIAHYTTELDLSWLPEPYPEPVRKGLMISGDRDLQPADINQLKLNYGAIAGDWESGAIAFVCQRNKMPCLILRGVSDLVGESGGEAYGEHRVFERAAYKLLARLISSLPAWLETIDLIRN